MSRRSRPLTEAEAQRLQAQARGEKAPAVSRLRQPRAPLGAAREVWSFVQPTGYRFVWVEALPKISGHQVHRFARSRLSKRARQVFGVLPLALYATRRARVEVIRVLGPGQKPMDRDSLAQLVAGVIDGLQPSYLVNDNETWSDITYRNDGTRRQQGPMLEIRLSYVDD